MITLRTILSASVLIAAYIGSGSGSEARAQTSAKHTTLAQAKPAAAQAASSWTCPFAVVEIVPVSHDTAGRPYEWVMVHRVKGEIVAAERVSAADVAQIRAMPCGAARPAPQAPLLG